MIGLAINGIGGTDECEVWGEGMWTVWVSDSCEPSGESVQQGDGDEGWVPGVVPGVPGCGDAGVASAESGASRGGDGWITGR